MFFKLIHHKEAHIYNPKEKASLIGLKAYVQTAFKSLPSKFSFCYLDEENDQITLSTENDFKIMMETSGKVVKIYIKETDEDFFDQTVNVQLDDEIESLANQVNDEKMDDSEFIEMQDSPKIEEKKEEEEEKEQKEEINESKIFLVQASQVSEADIQKKFKQLMPELIVKVKEQLIKQSAIKSSINVEVKEEKPKENSKIVHNVVCDECGIEDFEGVRYKCAVCADFDLCQACQTTSSHAHPFLKIKHPKQAPLKINVVYHDQGHNSFEFNGQRVSPFQMPFIKDIAQALFGSRQQGQQQEGFKIPKFWQGNCPYSNKWSKQCEKKEQKNEKMEQKKMPEKKEELKVIPKVEEKPEMKVEEKKATEDNKNIMKSAAYICDILGIDYNRCYKFAMKNAALTQEELLELYFSDTNQLA